MPDAGARGDIGAWTAFPQLIIREKGHDHVYSKTLGIIVIVQSSGFQNKSAVVAGTIKFELGRALGPGGKGKSVFRKVQVVLAADKLSLCVSKCLSE